MRKFKHNNKTYIAKEEDRCSGCAFDPLPNCTWTGVQECCAIHREDGRDIIWVEEEEA